MRIAAACLLAVGASSPLLYPEESSAGSGSGALAIVESLHGSLEARPETGETEAASFAHEGPDGRISAQAQGQALLLASLAATATVITGFTVTPPITSAVPAPAVAIRSNTSVPISIVALLPISKSILTLIGPATARVVAGIVV